VKKKRKEGRRRKEGNGRGSDDRTIGKEKCIK